MPKEAQIKSVIEEYLNLESAQNDYARSRQEATTRYNHLLAAHDAKHKDFDLHSAAPIISAYDEIRETEKQSLQARMRLKELGETIKGYIHALNGQSLDVRFMFDELNHRAGVHTFYLENDELKSTHAPAS